jgi:hypothetical protein
MPPPLFAELRPTQFRLTGQIHVQQSQKSLRYVLAAEMAVVIAASIVATVTFFAAGDTVPAVLFVLLTVAHLVTLGLFLHYNAKAVRAEARHFAELESHLLVIERAMASSGQVQFT